jgi:hypothetical protein
VVVASTTLSAQCRIAGRLVAAVSEPTPPYRQAGLQLRQLGERVSDDRTASPSTVTEGAAPDAVAGIAADVIVRLGLPGVGLAGQVPAPDRPVGHANPGRPGRGVLVAVRRLGRHQPGRHGRGRPGGGRRLPAGDLADRRRVRLREALAWN